MKKIKKREGFTLVELLIVIVVIGILSAMMMLSSNEAVSSAKAAKIISDLRNLKTAVLAWYADNLDYVESSKFTNLNDNSADILKYLGNEGVKGDYEFSDNNNDIGQDDSQRGQKVWYVWWIAEAQNDKKVIRKLAKRGQTAQLRFTHTRKDWQPSAGYFTEEKYDSLSDAPRCIGLHILGTDKYGAGR